MKRYFPFVIVALVALLVVGGGAMLYRAKRPPVLTMSKDTTSAKENDSGHIRGNPKAAVTLEEFGDYECPPCGKVSGPIKKLEEEYGDKLRVIFHHYPLIVHQHARDAAQAAEAAGLQGHFWEMHDLLYREQAVWTKTPGVRELFNSYAGLIGLDLERFKRDIDGSQVKARIEADQNEAKKVGVTATPTVFINNRAVSTATEDPAKPLRAAIDEALKAPKIDNS